MTTFRNRRLIAAALLLASVWPGGLAVQGQANEQERFLEVRRRQIELRGARSEYQRAEELFRAGLISKVELDRIGTQVDNAQLSYQEAVLALLGLQPRISVRAAVKFQTPDGRNFVRLTVVNLTPTFDDEQFRLLNNFEGADPIPAQLRTRSVKDIYISLQDSGGRSPEENGLRGVTIALPYEQHVAQLDYGQSRTLVFELLRDVASVVVAIGYKGQQREVPVQLQQAAIEGGVKVSSAQFSQEADLGSQATWDLRLDRASVDVRRFELKAVNLPRQVQASFIDPKSGARLSQVSFPAGVTQQSLQLRLSLPDRAGEGFALDRPLSFWAIVADDRQSGRFEAVREYSAEEIRASQTGNTQLQLIPRGLGKLEVTAPSLFAEISRGESVATGIVVRNAGTRRLDNVTVSAEPPLGWTAVAEPAVVASLDIGTEREVQLRITPPTEVSVGDYEVRLKTESLSFNTTVSSEEKSFRVRVEAGTNFVSLALLTLLLFAAVGGGVVFWIRLSRR